MMLWNILSNITLKNNIKYLHNTNSTLMIKNKYILYFYL